MAHHGLLTYLSVVAPFACGLAAMALTRDVWWAMAGLVPAALVGVQEWRRRRRL